jgi:hypothetical protein
MEIESQHRKPSLSSTLRCARIAHLTNGDPGIRMMGCAPIAIRAGKRARARLGKTAIVWARVLSCRLVVRGIGFTKSYRQNVLKTDVSRRQVQFYDNHPPNNRKSEIRNAHRTITEQDNQENICLEL